MNGRGSVFVVGVALVLAAVLSPLAADAHRDPATISVLKTATGGFVDLKKSLGKHACIFEWNGKQYTTTGQDPVADVNVGDR